MLQTKCIVFLAKETDKNWRDNGPFQTIFAGMDEESSNVFFFQLKRRNGVSNEKGVVVFYYYSLTSSSSLSSSLLLYTKRKEEKYVKLISRCDVFSQHAFFLIYYLSEVTTHKHIHTLKDS